jgi:hypothetical protein
MKSLVLSLSKDAREPQTNARSLLTIARKYL